jgi:hypothetical protein
LSLRLQIQIQDLIAEQYVVLAKRPLRQESTLRAEQQEENENDKDED